MSSLYKKLKGLGSPRNFVLLVLFIFALGIIGIIAKAVTKNERSFSIFGASGLGSLNISETQAQCWIPPGSESGVPCENSSGAECASGGESGEAGG